MLTGSLFFDLKLEIKEGNPKLKKIQICKFLQMKETYDGCDSCRV